MAKSIGIKAPYTVYSISSSDEEDAISFLEHEKDFSFFLLGNLKAHGLKISEEPNSGNFKLIRDSSGQIVAVFCLARRGNLLVQSTVYEPIFDLIVEACSQEPVPLKGVLGDWNFAAPFWNYLKSKEIIHKELYCAKEVLYRLELSKLSVKPQKSVRILTDVDFPEWQKLRLDYLSEMGLPNDLSDIEMRSQFLQKAAHQMVWGVFKGAQLACIAVLNAKTSIAGVVGGVYTPPNYRRQGLAKQLMHQLMLDAKIKHGLQKLFIFTGDTNIPARKLYEGLQTVQIGYFALLFGE